MSTLLITRLDPGSNPGISTKNGRSPVFVPRESVSSFTWLHRHYILPRRPSRGEPDHMHYIVYFLESVNIPNRHYIGYTTDLKKRIKAHNEGQNPSTKKFKPWKLIYAEMYLSKEDAMGREKFLKSGSGWKYLKKQLHNYLKNK